VNSTTAPWTDLSSGMAISQLYGFSNSSTSNYKILAGWQDNGTTLYDGPNTWRRVIGGDGMQCIIDYSDNTYQYGTIYYGRIYRSVNGGSSFSSIIANSGGAAGTVNEDGDWVTPYVLNPRNPTSLYVGKTRIYKSENRGNSWTALGAFPVTGGNIDAIAISPSDTNTIYASKSATIAKSTDGGANWTTVSTGLPGWFITSIFVDNRNKNNVYITCGATSAGQQVYQSQDGGASWASISGGLPALPANSIVMDTSSATRGLYVGLDAGVYYRDNNSGFWTLYNTNLPNVVINQLEIQYGVRKLRACTYGRGIWESDLASGSSPQQVLAAFTANRNSICRGEQIQYTDASLGGPTTWSWTFQGGTPASSTQRNPSVTYNTNGTYNVSLTVTNVNGDNSLTSTGFVTVSSVSPTLSITGTTEICAGSQASFTVNGTNLGSPANYTWLRNGTVITSTAANSFATAQLSNGDVITASTTSTANCAQPATVNTSNSVSLLVKPTPPKPTIEVLRNVPLNLLGNPGLTSANNINLGSSNATGNRWYFNGSTNTFSSDRVIRPVQAGSYQVVSTLNGCNSAPSDVYVLGVDRMEDLFKLYPVPSNGELIMEYFSVLNGSEITVNVISAAGQIVYTKNFNSVLGLNTQKLGLQTLASGQYTLQLQTVNRSYQKSFLIQLK
jgi:PKD repeat protein